jgi:hypothetical protein
MKGASLFYCHYSSMMQEYDSIDWISISKVALSQKLGMHPFSLSTFFSFPFRRFFSISFYVFFSASSPFLLFFLIFLVSLFWLFSTLQFASWFHVHYAGLQPTGTDANPSF